MDLQGGWQVLPLDSTVSTEELPRNLEEFGLGQYEGRGWRGFHHHATLCIGRLSVSILRAASDALLN